MSVSIWVLFPFHLLFFICLSALLPSTFSPPLTTSLLCSPLLLRSDLYLLIFLHLSFSPHHSRPLSEFLPSSFLYLLLSLSFPSLLFFFFFLSFVYLASSPLHLSCGLNSPITAGRNYAWKLIRRSLNNYPLMQLIDFPFQELCFFVSWFCFSPPRASFLILFNCVWVFFFGQVQVEFAGAKTPRK